MKNLNQLVIQLETLKMEEKEAKAKVVAAQEEIKALLKEANLDSYTSEGYLVTYTPYTRSTVNEEKLINTIKKLARNAKDAESKAKIKASVKKVDSVDELYLESLLFDGTIDAEKLTSCYEAKTTWTLRSRRVQKRVQKTK